MVFAGLPSTPVQNCERGRIILLMNAIYIHRFLSSVIALAFVLPVVFLTPFVIFHT